MPWPMVHLAISQRLYSGSPTPELLLGSLAPDAVHVRGNVTREEKGMTHLVHAGKLPNPQRIFEKFNEYVEMRQERGWNDFIIGYFTHIYTDLRWTETLYTEFEQRYAGDRIREVYNTETSQLEFELQKSVKETAEIKRQLACANGYTIPPFVTADEVKRYRDLKLNWLNDPGNEPCIPNVYFTGDQVERFITETTAELKANLQPNKKERM